MMKEAKRGRIFTIVCLVVTSCSFIGFSMGSIFNIDIRIISNITDYGNRNLFAQSYYPYDYSKSPYFELTNLSQMIAATFIGVSITVTENYFGALVFHASAQYQILNEEIKKLFCDADNKEHQETKQIFKKNLVYIVERHTHLSL